MSRIGKMFAFLMPFAVLTRSSKWLVNDTVAQY